MADEPYATTSNGGSPSGRGSGQPSGKRVPWGGTTKPDDEYVQVRLRAGTVRKFDAWYASQIPDARQRPSADPVRDKVFDHGLEAFIVKFPPVQTLDDRLAQLEAGK
jgi:hypothetical protein